MLIGNGFQLTTSASLCRLLSHKCHTQADFTTDVDVWMDNNPVMLQHHQMVLGILPFILLVMLGTTLEAQIDSGQKRKVV